MRGKGKRLVSAEHKHACYVPVPHASPPASIRVGRQPARYGCESMLRGGVRLTTPRHKAAVPLKCAPGGDESNIFVNVGAAIGADGEAVSRIVW